MASALHIYRNKLFEYMSCFPDWTMSLLYSKNCLLYFILACDLAHSRILDTSVWQALGHMYYIEKWFWVSRILIYFFPHKRSQAWSLVQCCRSKCKEGLFQGDRNTLHWIGVMAAQLYKLAKNHGTVYFNYILRRINFMVYKLYFNKIVKIRK